MFTENKGIYTCAPWAEFVWQKHGFGSRHAPHPPALTLRQVHSGEVRAAGDFADRELKGDALVTGDIARPIGVRTADCLSILLLDPRLRTIAAVHAGWRGTTASIVANTIAKLRSEYGSDPADLQAAIGPSIRVCCYEVSVDVAAQFAPECVREIQDSPRPHLDLAAANKQQLLEAGLAEKYIFDCELCTVCRPDQFFSYRREPANPGRMLSYICRTD
ncbi:MAG TPA: peptidoglycan editing factor PgeF [Bryobacteraceae bacterium]